ncbi:hypothetical protein SprV_0702412300 [Sparganum proliferum]
MDETFFKVVRHATFVSPGERTVAQQFVLRGEYPPYCAVPVTQTFLTLRIQEEEEGVIDLGGTHTEVLSSSVGQNASEIKEVFTRLLVSSEDNWDLEVSIFFTQLRLKMAIQVEVICVQIVTESSRQPAFLETVHQGEDITVVGPNIHPFEFAKSEQRLTFWVNVNAEHSDEPQRTRLSFAIRFHPPNDFCVYVEIEGHFWMALVLTGLQQTSEPQKTQMIPVMVPNEVVSGDVVRYEFEGVTNVSSDFDFRIEIDGAWATIQDFYLDTECHFDEMYPGDFDVVFFGDHASRVSRQISVSGFDPRADLRSIYRTLPLPHSPPGLGVQIQSRRPEAMQHQPATVIDAPIVNSTPHPAPPTATTILITTGHIPNAMPPPHPDYRHHPACCKPASVTTTTTTTTTATTPETTSDVRSITILPAMDSLTVDFDNVHRVLHSSAGAETVTCLLLRCLIRPGFRPWIDRPTGTKRIELLLRLQSQPDAVMEIGQELGFFVDPRKSAVMQMTISKVEDRELLKIRQIKDIVTLPAGKERLTVVMDKAEHCTKQGNLLMDKEAYAPSTVNEFKKLINSINNMIGKLRKAGVLTRREALAEKVNDAAMARFYGLPKVHKQGVRPRPIVSLRGTPTFGLSKWPYQRLCFLTKDSPWTVKSAEEFLTRIKHLDVEADEVMGSFDVISLFISILPALAIDTIDCFLREKYDETDQQLKRAHIIGLKAFFTVNGQVYEQKKGIPMGSPLSGLIAEAVLQRLEQLVFSSYPPKFCARYVDDTFVVIKRSEAKAFKTLLNSIVPDIQFTKEEEANNQLPFLDEEGVSSARMEAHLMTLQPGVHVKFVLHFKPPVALADLRVKAELHSSSGAAVGGSNASSRIQDMWLLLGEGFVPLTEEDQDSIQPEGKDSQIHCGPIYNTGIIYEQYGVVPRTADHLTLHLIVTADTEALVAVDIHIGSQLLRRQFKLEKPRNTALRAVPVFLSSMRWPNRPQGNLKTG